MNKQLSRVAAVAMVVSDSSAWAEVGEHSVTEQWQQGLMGVVVTGVVLMVVGMYFIPTIAGFIRNKSNKMAILILNLFLGWTLLGWVVALVWAFTKDEKKL